MQLNLKVHAATEEVLSRLEEKGVISRLMPRKHLLEVKHGESKHQTVYAAADRFGPHKLIAVTINSTEPKNFLYHSEDEDFFIIDGKSEPLLITMTLLHKDLLEKKIQNQTLSEEDFMVVAFKPNDPYSSFFTMHKYFAHVETTLKASDFPPSFYVAESRDIDENIIDLKSYTLNIKGETYEKIRN